MKGILQNVDKSVLDKLSKSNPDVLKTVGKIFSNEVSLNWHDYNLGLMAESGFGKTTLAFELCHKYLGQDGYIHLNIGKEDGIDALDEITGTNIKTWKDLKDIVDAVVNYKEELFPNLEMIVYDTVDELILLAQDEVVKLHQRANPTERNVTINGAFGGFQEGQKMARRMILDEIDRLTGVGVRPFYIFHTKSRTKADEVTGVEYDVLTSKLGNSDFNEFKTKIHVLGTGYIDRSIQVEVKEGFMGKKEETGRMQGQKRMISFRSDTGVLDCKSRLKYITPEIEFSADEFVKAIQDAIEEEFGSDRDIDKARKKQDKNKVKKAKELSSNNKKNDLFKEFTEGIKKADSDTQNEIAEYLKSNSIAIEDLKDTSSQKIETYEAIVGMLG